MPASTGLVGSATSGKAYVALGLAKGAIGRTQMAIDDRDDLSNVDPYEIVSLVGVGDTLTLREAVRHVLNQEAMLADMATVLRGPKKQPSVLNKAAIDLLALRADFRINRSTETIPLKDLNSSNDE
jgi:hypothetical protein